MIPQAMEAFLRERLPERTWQTRLTHDNGRAYLEFSPLDVEQLGRLGIGVDSLGPQLVVCLWDEKATIEIGGYLVVDNLAMGRPSMGGIRMLPTITPAAVHNLARGMTLKNAAAQLPFGGGKAGIVAGRDLDPAAHTEVVRGFARLLRKYREIYIPGPDVGTNDADMKTVAIENGLDSAVSKPSDMGGNRIDQLGAAGGGTIIALEALLEEMPRLRQLPMFSALEVPPASDVAVLIEGFGAVGAHAARTLRQRWPEARVVGISDEQGYLFDPAGLPVDELFGLWRQHGLVTRRFGQRLLEGPSASLKVSTAPDDLLRESAFCLIPAAPVANYLDTDAASGPAMTVDRMGRWSVIIEGANTYSPDPARRRSRARMERAVYRERGILIATDYLVNSGGVIFAAQERILKTPPDLRIPEAMLGDRQRVQAWLDEHRRAFEELAERRRLAGEAARDAVIHRNMHELVEALAADDDLLPCQAAERISVRRMASRESDRTAADVLEPMPLIAASSTIEAAARHLVECGCPILAVVDDRQSLVGVVTEWDFMRATAEKIPSTTPLETIMTRKVVSAEPSDTLLEVLRKLELNQISAMPVVERGQVNGMVSSDLLARGSLVRMLQSQRSEQ